MGQMIIDVEAFLETGGPVLNVIGIFVVLIPFLVISYRDQIRERT